MRGRPKAVLKPTEAELAQLTKLARSGKTPQRLASRARIGLEGARGASNIDVASKLGVAEQTVGKWRARFIFHGLGGLADAHRSGAPRTITDDQVHEVVGLTQRARPCDATHWSTRAMAREMGLSHSSIHRIWRAFGLQPHRERTFKLSNDPLFAEKTTDIVGLYMSPPRNAVVLCVDEKTQIQALDRTQPELPLAPGIPAQRTHDYRRNGTTTLFTAYNVATGKVIAQTHRKHRAEEFLKFLRAVDAEVPEDLDIHIVMDNYSTHKTPKVRGWFARRPRFHVHFTPTYSSWINLVERWFALLTQQQVRRGTFHSVRQLEEVLKNYVKVYNENPKPFVWTKPAADILESIGRYKMRTSNTVH